MQTMKKCKLLLSVAFIGTLLLVSSLSLAYASSPLNSSNSAKPIKELKPSLQTMQQSLEKYRLTIQDRLLADHEAIRLKSKQSQSSGSLEDLTGHYLDTCYYEEPSWGAVSGGADMCGAPGSDQAYGYMYAPAQEAHTNYVAVEYFEQNEFSTGYIYVTGHASEYGYTHGWTDCVDIYVSTFGNDWALAGYASLNSADDVRAGAANPGDVPYAWGAKYIAIEAWGYHIGQPWQYQNEEVYVDGVEFVGANPQCILTVLGTGSDSNDLVASVRINGIYSPYQTPEFYVAVPQSYTNVIQADGCSSSPFELFSHYLYEGNEYYYNYFEVSFSSDATITVYYQYP